MKKLLSVSIAFLLIFSCFAVSAFAEDVAISPDKDYDYWGAIYYETQPVMTLSDGYKKLYVDGESYSRFNTEMLTTDLGYTVDVAEKHNPYSHTGAFVDLTDEQAAEIDRVFIETNNIKNMYRFELYFKDGSMLTLHFLQDTYFDDYNKIISGNASEYTVDFSWPENNTVVAQKDALFGEKVMLNKADAAEVYENYAVLVKNGDGSLVAYVGAVFEIDEKFYYLDYAEAGVDSEFLYGGALTEVYVHKITDEALHSQLQTAQQLYYDDDYGVLYDDDATDTISAVFLIFVFAVVPFVIFVIFLVKAIRGKGTYKKIYGTVSAICIAAIIVFIIIAVIISPASLDNKTIEEFAMELDVNYGSEDVYLLKEAVYCGDGDCTDDCATGYFYRGENCTEEDAMLKLELGEPNGLSDEYWDYKPLYTTSFEENIVVETTEFENGYIVEYTVIGVG